LREPVTVDASSSEEEHRQNAENLLRILGEFNVEVTLGEIHVGRSSRATRSFPLPAPRGKDLGPRQDIALGMRAQSVRIMAPIPGKARRRRGAQPEGDPGGPARDSGIGDWAGAKADLPIALGKDVSGKPLVSDLAKMLTC